MAEREFITEALRSQPGSVRLQLLLARARVDVRLRIYEPPRFSRRSRGRAYTEVPDITARICGICPVAYQTASMSAMEAACGVQVPETIRRCAGPYCGEWIESHALHVFFLHGPDSRLPERLRWRATIPGSSRARYGSRRWATR
jgi:coenzyme F420-reducing hydrogenase alpha subunit